MKPRIGFLVTHGTDTMAWGHAYLSYALCDLGFNVALVGSQIPLDDSPGGSDAYLNLESAVMALAEVTPPRVLVSMNVGKTIFRDHVWKTDKWDVVAFDGRVAREKRSNQIIYDRAVGLREQPDLDVLVVLKTGGTIEQSFQGGALRPDPAKDSVTRFLRETFGEPKADRRFTVESIRSYSLMARDSSDLTVPDWNHVADEIVRQAQEFGYTPSRDEGIGDSVGVVMATPLTRDTDYRHLALDKPGVVFIGYGGGNVNLAGGGYSPLEFFREHRRAGRWLVLASQPDRGIVDPLYENGKAVFDERLALPALDFSPARCQVKLAYILGHLERVAERSEVLALGHEGVERLIAILFLSGGQFLRRATRDYFESLWSVTIPESDLLFDRRFSDALDLAGRYLRLPARRAFDFRAYLETHPERTDAADRRAALILKPDAVVGATTSGAEIDASRSLERFLQKAFEWDVVTLDLLEGFDHAPDPLRHLARFHVLFLEGGRQSVYRESSFDERAPYATRQEMIAFYRTLIGCRAINRRWPPAMFIGLSHQLAAQALLELVLGALPRLARVDEGAGEVLSREIRGCAERLALLPHPQAVRPSETLGGRVVALRPYVASPHAPRDLAEAHAVVAERYPGLVEDALPSERLDIAMVQAEEVREATALFINWALSRIEGFRRARRDSLAPSSDLWALPAGFEITSSTREIGSADARTEVASAAIHYCDRDGLHYRDLAFQFHPELLLSEKTREIDGGEEADLSVANDGAKILVSAVMGAFARFRTTPGGIEEVDRWR
jgi:L-asparaginase/Glu-tRNA(Gln) amidotransferase subunit D